MLGLVVAGVCALGIAPPIRAAMPMRSPAAALRLGSAGIIVSGRRSSPASHPASNHTFPTRLGCIRRAAAKRDGARMTGGLGLFGPDERPR